MILIEKEKFFKLKSYLDGLVFWREIDNKIEIKIAVYHKYVKQILK